MVTGSLLITGGTGSLGKALLKRLVSEDVRITVLSRDETKQSVLKSRFPDVRFVLCDVRDVDKLNLTFRGQDIIIHAAAYKQIPSSQVNCDEAIQTNVIGSRNVARAAVLNHVKRVVGISTDKACMPVNLYGTTKAAMEALFQQYSHDYDTVFTLTRYGNVICSNASVIPYFMTLKAEGRPLTVTDKRMTRFWISLEQAVDLVIEALSLEDGQIVVPRAPASRVWDLASWIAEDLVPIVETSIRPGEKLHECMVSSMETLHTQERTMDFVIHPPYETPINEVSTGYCSSEAPPVHKGWMMKEIAHAYGI